MEEIKFRPLRIIKKTGKITVASYMQWHKLKCMDYNSFNLIIDYEYKSFPKDALVHDHKGEVLFWRHYNPEDIPMLNRYSLVDGETPPYPPMWKTDYGMYSAKGLDVNGTPTFSHQTAQQIANGGNDVTQYEPLTVEVVSWWFGWFLYQLKNVNLIEK